MSANKNVKTDASVESASPHAPRKMTFAENVVLTIKVLAGFGVLFAALWGINLWTNSGSGQ